MRFSVLSLSLALAAGALSVAPVAWSGESAAPDPAAAVESDPAMAAAKADFEAICSNCHELYITTDQRKNRADWEKTMNKMVIHGAPMTEDQASAILDYLSKQYALAK